MKGEGITIIHLLSELVQSVSAWTLMRLMKVVRTRNLQMYSKASLVDPDWEIDSIPMATKAAKHVSLFPRTFPSLDLNFLEEELMLHFRNDGW